MVILTYLPNADLFVLMLRTIPLSAVCVRLCSADFAAVFAMSRPAQPNLHLCIGDVVNAISPSSHCEPICAYGRSSFRAASHLAQRFSACYITLNKRGWGEKYTFQLKRVVMTNNKPKEWTSKRR